MITKKIFRCIQLFFFIFVVSMTSSAMADPATKVCPLLDKALDNLNTATSCIEKFNIVERYKGRIALLKAHTNIAGAELQMYKLHLLDLPVTELIDMTPADLQELLDLLGTLATVVPEVGDLLKMGVESGLETIKVETLLLCVQASMAVADLLTIGLVDISAVTSINLAKKILGTISEGICVPPTP